MKSRHKNLPAKAPEPERSGRIITFYSYKGGTGRSLAVANIAWILADSGKRVLVIDWDLEAPGLHRYFHPFLEDKHLAGTLGLIDFMTAFVEGSRIAKGKNESPETSWYEPYANFYPYALSLRGFKFRKGGGLDFMPAGRQDGGYAVKVTRFDWQDFYESLGGGVFLQAFKQTLREQYDYVLIDSRTGISDTSGICTVQMPDELVVCFTYNSQSILGAEAAARSALSQRLRPSGKPSLRVWPVPTRVDLSEHTKLEAARLFAREAFQPFLNHLKSRQRRVYWDLIEVPYVPYLAFEEVLAPFADRSRSKLSILDSLAALTKEFTDGAVKKSPLIPEHDRKQILAQFERAAVNPISRAEQGQFYLSFAVEDMQLVSELGKKLNDIIGDGSVVWDAVILRAGDKWPDVLREALNHASAVLIIVSENWLKKSQDSHSRREAERALKIKKLVVPVLVGVQFSDLSSLPKPLNVLSQRQGYFVSPDDSDSAWNDDVETLATQLQKIRERTATNLVDTDDPQKGQWGGQKKANGRLLKAKVIQTKDEDWYEIEIEVVATNKQPLTGPVIFHLHPTFVPAIRSREADGKKAVLSLNAYGAFTVGVEADDGNTKLELDLAKLKTTPKGFRDQ